ncbi:MAG: UDP-N-acetylmuramate dehydrogenase [Egibacteraceae bacterium]
MADALVDALRAHVSGSVLADASLAGHTTLKVGGPAAALVRAETPDDLAAVARVCGAHDRPWLVIGRGSNLLVADGGWPGVAVTLGRGFRGVAVDESAATAAEGEAVGVVAGAAEPMPVLAKTVARHHLGGLAFGVAIPGSLGGAVRMNAGAHGHELREVLEWAQVARLERHGALERLHADDLAMSYRHTALAADAVVVRARLRLYRADAVTLDADMAEMRRWRRAHQPINQPSCGSVFRNPPGDSAGRLIQAAGMKGHRVGGAQVSPVHANFITVESSARAGDVHAVIRNVQETVRAREGVALQTEVILAGFDEGPVTEGRSWA